MTDEVGQTLTALGLGDNQANRALFKAALQAEISEDGPRPRDSMGSSAVKAFSAAYREKEPDLVERAADRVRRFHKHRRHILGNKELRDLPNKEMSARQLIAMGLSASSSAEGRRKNYRD